MHAGLPIAILFFAASPLTASAQVQPRSTDTTPPSTSAAAPPPVISCASLANLRTVLRDAKDDAVAAIPVITDPKSDLGCSLLDRRAVTGTADHVALNGRAYECLSLQGTNVCHWTVAGSATPPTTAAAPTRPAPSPSSQGKSKR
ncbi:hypothetical protein [Methylobacterium haplocladii]|uniref:Uncharacterized protein n=1 Tax=Methylobacterium haplocladii TaxID=1176176 RepID=A0A512ILW7_9HYPH|nr:hypothetical protein [Methylobacterium haplocladii]GEO98638.1 hypothetical protein MHA02_10260 [Methylobacterium haplocladii]GJD83961.1 hypothetical protein HPGCJGGD_1836 [Methylobacterium haplocladii]GLS59467.1 hypothetical protein GCM10007887_21360 [Methylobacterium haplocladii]